MSFESADPGHGHSTAAWTAVTIMLIAFTIGTVAFFFEVVWLVWASAALLLLGLAAGWIMAKAGYGAASTDGSH
jgi:membrane protein YdbS with pleckstrin-like domain